ncbi:MAG: hypothetical protein Q7S05_04455 [bacterium]|nr:hypothetical protein [bacterium]
MANVLPKETIQSVWRDYRNRLILVSALVFLAIAALAFLSLLPAYVVLKVEENSEANQASATSTQSNPNPQSRTERNDITRAQTLLVRATQIVFATSSPTEVFGAALALRPDGVTVSKITFVSGGKGTVEIIGESMSRDSINNYREALSKDKRFKSVSVPVGALVGGEDGKFTITLTGDF